MSVYVKAHLTCSSDTVLEPDEVAWEALNESVFHYPSNPCVWSNARGISCMAPTSAQHSKQGLIRFDHLSDGAEGLVLTTTLNTGLG